MADNALLSLTMPCACSSASLLVETLWLSLAGGKLVVLAVVGNAESKLCSLIGPKVAGEDTLGTGDRTRVDKSCVFVSLW